MKYIEAAQHNVYQNKIESFAKDPIDSLYMQFGSPPAGMPTWQVLANRNQYGDNDVIARKVCSEVGFLNPVVITGSYLASLDETKFEETVFTNAIFAKLTPLQKERIVKTLKNRNNVVGFMGDGINDAPALNAADIGISVDDAVDIARENADFILLEQDLTILNAGVEEGRKTYANTIKYIKCTASSNFGNIFSLIGASALFPFLPMLPLQILILNLIYDLSQTALPWDNVDKEFLKTPHAWDVSSITRFILKFVYTNFHHPITAYT